MNQRTDTQLFNKFPFYLYKSENWDVEHIASNTDNDLTQPSEQKEWLKHFCWTALFLMTIKIELNVF